MKQLVTVITRTKNRTLFLERAMKSVCSQTYRDFCWCIINDGGLHDPVEKVAENARTAGLPVLTIHHEVSKGMETASNAGIRQTVSKYIVIHDDDDTWEPLFLEKSVDFMESEQGRRYGGVLTATKLIVEKVVRNKIVCIKREPYNDWMRAVYLVDMAQSNTFAPIAFLYRRSVYDLIGGYDETFPVLGDWKFNIEFLLVADIALLREPLANYHKRTGAIDLFTGNTVTIGRFQHHEFDALFRNDLLRRETKAGKFGIGLLLNLVKEYQGFDGLLSWQSFKRILRRSRLGWIVRYL